MNDWHPDDDGIGPYLQPTERHPVSAGQNKLTSKQLVVIEQLLAGRSQQEAADAAGVRRETVGRWKRQHPAFIARLNAGRHQLYEAGMAELLAARRDAIHALRQIVTGDLPSKPWERLRAINMILNHCHPPRGETDPQIIAKRVQPKVTLDSLIERMERATRTQPLLPPGLLEEDLG